MIQGDHTNTTQTGTQAHTLARTEARRHGGEVKMRDREWPSTAPEWSPSLQAGKPTKELSHSRSWVHLPRFQPTCRAQTVFSIGQAERRGPWSTHGAHSHFHCFAFSFEKKAEENSLILQLSNHPIGSKACWHFLWNSPSPKGRQLAWQPPENFFWHFPPSRGRAVRGTRKFWG